MRRCNLRLGRIDRANGRRGRLGEDQLRERAISAADVDPGQTLSLRQQVLYGYIRYEDAFDRIWRNYFAVAVSSVKTHGRDFYQTVGGKAYNAEIQEK